MEKIKSINNQKILKIDDESFEFVKTRTYTPISVYKGENTFLRIGTGEELRKELELHKELLKCKFPIAEILKEGTYEGQFFYIEKALGTMPLGSVFTNECKENGKISDNSFLPFLKLSEQFAKAQLLTASKSGNFEKDAYTGFHMDYVVEELPKLKDELIRAFQKMNDTTSIFPVVITHGDCNPYNLFDKGIIDIENNFHAHAGYDLISNIYSTYCFPKNGDYENKRRYEFTSAQIAEYMQRIDKVYTDAGLPKLSVYQDDFMFARIVWATARMQYTPKLQKWRYDLLEKTIANYIEDKPVIDVLMNFPV